GAAAAIERGFIQREIQDAAYTYQKSVDTGSRTVVGVNRFTAEEDQKYDYLRVDPETEREQVRRLSEMKSGRDGEKVEKALAVLRIGAKGEDNLVPLILDAVKAYATIGEICGVLRDIFGEYKAADL
ncbi:methylmalonyl-CoA mutase, partial [Candidatus Thorarchaeota archaeon]